MVRLGETSENSELNNGEWSLGMGVMEEDPEGCQGSNITVILNMVMMIFVY